MFYTLVLFGRGSLHVVAQNRDDALVQFGKELGHALVDKPTGVMAEYQLDEWETGPHWTNATIPIWKKR